ncbi:MAG: EamA/RhaT family transporter [Campylobacter sp.]|nr:EamA/RhaT family transporter [Campylobacter sp.]
MEFLFLAIIASVSVSVVLKLANTHGIDIAQAVAFNYIATSTLCFAFFSPNLADLSLKHSYLFLVLGVLLPSGFIIMAKAVKFAGIIRSDAAQRLSLFLPIIAAFVIFGESITTLKICGIILAFLALFCLLFKGQTSKLNIKGAFYLLLVWLVYGICDILFKQISKLGNAFSLTLFVGFVIAGVVMFGYLWAIKRRPNIKNAIWGLVLGGLNFANIIFYIKAHQSFSKNPSLVFVAMNVGVIIFGVLVGAGVFKESISRVNAVGILVGICAITALFWG